MFGRRHEELSPLHKDLSVRITDMYLDGGPDKFNFTEDFLELTNMFTDSSFGQGSDLIVK